MRIAAIVISKRVHSQIMYASEDRQSKGAVSVEVFQWRLRVRLPRQLFDGKQKYLTLGLSDTKINLKISIVPCPIAQPNTSLINSCTLVLGMSWYWLRYVTSPLMFSPYCTQCSTVFGNLLTLTNLQCGHCFFSV